MHRSVIHVEDLSVRAGTHVVLEDLRFSLPEGALLSIVGPNGAGKTTLLRALLGLVAPFRGDVRVLGVVPSAVAPGAIAYVPQIKTLDRRFPSVAIELVLSGLRRRWPGPIGRDDRERALTALRLVAADHLERKPIGALSGGEMQRVYLARSLVGEPKLIFLDEPVTGIDAVGEQDFYSCLEDYRRRTNATLLIITHDWQVASFHSTHVLVLNRRQIGFGPPSEALSEECLRRAYGHLGHMHDRLRMGGGTSNA
ncbi:MAG: metal ABC transporter ATP-binding protein [Candidatus Latescibacterota bacterium]|nr:MAG: metal ABC transporter ATP-binding protein [Candidatus Latescibacterota bacterium]